MTSPVTVPMDLEEKDARLKLICVPMLNVSMETVLTNSTDMSKFRLDFYNFFFHTKFSFSYVSLIFDPFNDHLDKD